MGNQLPKARRPTGQEQPAAQGSPAQADAAHGEALEDRGDDLPQRRYRHDLAPEGASFEERCSLAAGAIADAEVLLLTTGAGFSCGNGLLVYRDVASVPAYREKGLKYKDICNPAWVDEDPAFFYGFWGACFNDHRSARPNEGYAIVAKWRRILFSGTAMAKSIRQQVKSKDVNEGHRHRRYDPYKCKSYAGAFFHFTSNIDAHAFDYFTAGEVRECHGNSELWQCSESCSRKLWRAPPDLAFAVDARTLEASDDPNYRHRKRSGASAAGQPDGRLLLSGGAKSHRENFLAGWPTFEETKAITELFWNYNRPMCPKCGLPARPAVLMFSDLTWVDQTSQDRRYHSWLEALEAECQSRRQQPVRVAILEIGAGKSVPTVRMNSQSVACRLEDLGAKVTVIRVNPANPFPDGIKGARLKQFLSIKAKGVETLQAIDRAMAGTLDERAVQAMQEAGTEGPARQPDGLETAETAEAAHAEAENSPQDAAYDAQVSSDSD